jgi:hypothetical protein
VAAQLHVSPAKLSASAPDDLTAIVSGVIIVTFLESPHHAEPAGWQKFFLLG